MLDLKSLTIPAENLEEEKETFEQIKHSIDNKRSFVFDTGAGAGKTYELIQSLKYIISKYGDDLNTHNQNILCITFTNAATREIKERLGNSTLAKISTIHEAIWEIIQPYQKQLVEIHCEKLKHEVKKSQDQLNSDKWAEKYTILTSEEKSLLFDIMSKNKEFFWEHYDDASAQFKESISPLMSNSFPDILSNVSNFKKIISSLFRVERYEYTIKQIAEKEQKYSKITYDARYNTDQLEKMYISHDTVLEYAQKIITTYPLLMQIICNKYPFVLVDEYQDTSKPVVVILSSIDSYAKNIAHGFTVGYYGDRKQKIYGDGVGDGLRELHSELDAVTKSFNRRSSLNIITIANCVRDDAIKQNTIYLNFPNNEVIFYNNSEKGISKDVFIDYYKTKWSIDNNNKLHCLELTNELVATQNKITNFYNFFKNAPLYSGANYQNMNTQTLSTDITKLGYVQKHFFDIINFKNNIEISRTMITAIVPATILNEMKILELRALINDLQQIKGESIKEYLENMFKIYQEASVDFKSCINQIFHDDIITLRSFERFLLESLYRVDGDDNEIDISDLEDMHLKIDEFLQLPFTEFNLWYNFITNQIDDEVVFHTYHGTKGLEFDNVIIFLSARFGLERNYFSRYFKDLNNPGASDNPERFRDAQNLLYVAITRARRNLVVFYEDDITDFSENLKRIFPLIKNGLE